MRNQIVVPTLPPTLDTLVAALCADYQRREKAIREGSVIHRVDTEYRYYNFKIYDAVAAIVGEGRCERIIKEIGGRIGYAHSALEEVSEVTYKKMKKEVKDAVARALHLI